MSKSRKFRSTNLHQNGFHHFLSLFTQNMFTVIVSSWVLSWGAGSFSLLPPFPYTPSTYVVHWVFCSGVPPPPSPSLPPSSLPPSSPLEEREEGVGWRGGRKEKGRRREMECDPLFYPTTNHILPPPPTLSLHFPVFPHSHICTFNLCCAVEEASAITLSEFEDGSTLEVGAVCTKVSAFSFSKNEMSGPINLRNMFHQRD